MKAQKKNSRVPRQIATVFKRWKFEACLVNKTNKINKVQYKNFSFCLIQFSYFHNFLDFFKVILKRILFLCFHGIEKNIMFHLKNTRYPFYLKKFIKNFFLLRIFLHRILHKK